MAAPQVAGTGFLADELGRRLSADPPAGVDTVLVAELDRIGEHHDLIVECLGTGRPLLFVGTYRSLVYIGPLWASRVPGCPHCLVTRTANSPFGPDLRGDTAPESSRRDTATFTLGPGVLAAVERLVRERMADSGPDGPGSPDCEVTVVDGVTATVDRQVLLPDSTCASCGGAEADTVPVFTPREVPLPKLGPRSLRTAELDADTVAKDYLFAGIGLFKEVRQDLQSPIGACSVELGTRWGRREPAIGRGRTYRSSRTIAVLEGLERYAGLHRGGRSAPVRACYADVADRAIDPTTLGTHPEASYAEPGFRFRRFDRDTVVDWVWAYSMRRGERVLLPERAAFWGPRHDGETAFLYDTSNGCALGNSAEEAVLHGLREVAERDSFLMAWYRRLALPEIDMVGADAGLDALLRKAELFTGFRFRAFLSTMEYRMPCTWLVAESRLDDGPRVFAGAGAHPDPVQAIAGGLHELIGSVLATRHSYERRRADGLAMLADPALMTRMEDHSLVGALPEARERWSFLLDADAGRVALADVPGTLREREPDLRADLDVAVSGVLAAGMDVLVVDQTMPELRRNGLTCVRVVVPGAVPMTFGHRNRRTRDLPRLAGGAGLPYRSGLVDGEEPGCVPHPFP
uniref:NocG n=1 Tax=Nocardia sp. ATCC 202099 TaxID=930400 RepID=E5DUH9_9NOCA|nr:NocG [Nocardia sp. ATCC 202099]